jgi:hypothetical protein
MFSNIVNIYSLEGKVKSIYISFDMSKLINNWLESNQTKEKLAKI